MGGIPSPAWKRPRASDRRDRLAPFLFGARRRHVHCDRLADGLLMVREPWQGNHAAFCRYLEALHKLADGEALRPVRHQALWPSLLDRVPRKRRRREHHIRVVLGQRGCRPDDTVRLASPLIAAAS